MPAELEDARIACLEWAGITLEYGLGQTARSRFWWEQHPMEATPDEPGRGLRALHTVSALRAKSS